MSFADEIHLTPREFLAGVIAAISLCGSLAFGYGVKAQQVFELQGIVVKHDIAIQDLIKELTSLRLTVAELNGTLMKGK